jgi:hypothetical protein
MDIDRLRRASLLGMARSRQSLSEPSPLKSRGDLLDQRDCRRLLRRSFLEHEESRDRLAIDPRKVPGLSRCWARYTHRVAISNARLVRLEGDRVTFTYKDSSQGGRVREMTLPAEELIRRFLLHVLPAGFVRIRHYGLMSNRHRTGNLARCRELLAGVATAESAPAKPSAKASWQARLLRLTGKDPTLCPHCGRGHLHRVEDLKPVNAGVPGRSPP